MKLIIESVTTKDGGWVAEGCFGSTGENLGRRSIQVLQQGGDIILEFVAGAKTPNPVRLKLVGERKFEGTINVVVGGRVERVIEASNSKKWSQKRVMLSSLSASS